MSKAKAPATLLSVLKYLGQTGYVEEADCCLALCQATVADSALTHAVARTQYPPVGRTRLMYAAMRGNLDRVQFLLGCGADLNASLWAPANGLRMSALLMAALTPTSSSGGANGGNHSGSNSSSRTGLVVELCRRSEVYLPDALVAASACGLALELSQVLERMELASIAASGSLDLDSLDGGLDVSSGSSSVLETLPLEKEAVYRMWAMSVACDARHREVAAFWAADAAIDATAALLMIAETGCGWIAEARTCLARGADVQGRMRGFEARVSPLEAALGHNDKDMVAELCKHPDVPVGEALAAAVRVGLGVEAVAPLLARVQSWVVATAGKEPLRPSWEVSLQHAINNGAHDVVLLICQQPWIQPSIALLQTAKLGHVEACRVLLSRLPRRTDVAAVKGHRKETPLMLAAANGHLDIMTLLLLAGAELEAADEDGRTALHMAVQRGSLPATALLLAARAKAGVKDKRGATPLDMAQKQGNAKLVALLQRPDDSPMVQQLRAQYQAEKGTQCVVM